MAAPAEQVHFITLHLRSRHLIPLRPSSQIGIKKENWGPLEQPLEVPPGTGAIEVEEDHTTLPVLRIPLKDLRKLLDNLDWLKHLSRIISGVRNGSLAKLDPPPSTNPVIPDGAELPEESTDYVWEPNILMQNQRCMFLMRIFVGNRGKVVKKDQVSVAKVSNLAESSFSGSVTRRDRSQCKISAFKRGEGYCNTSSHLIPKVLGPVATLSIVVRLGAQISFLELEGDEKPGTVAEDEKPRHEQGDLGWKTPYRQWQHDPRVGVLLHAEFNTLVDRFKMGFYRDQPVEEQDVRGNYFLPPSFSSFFLRRLYSMAAYAKTTSFSSSPSFTSTSLTSLSGRRTRTPTSQRGGQPRR